MAPVITTESLEFSYGDTPVLRGLDLSVEAGEVVCLLGPNGVGKTTLVENLLGSLTPTSGRVRVLGTDPRRAGADFWARIGLVQQSWTDHAKWRVRDQLEWIRSVQLTAASRVSGVEEVLDAVGLSEKADSRLSRLSGGQRRTIDFAAALMASLSRTPRPGRADHRPGPGLEGAPARPHPGPGRRRRHDRHDHP